tara:strand:+ start:33549 stop:33881 length:333 start_codon:yes stop_codon:yes gene_type:complete
MPSVVLEILRRLIFWAAESKSPEKKNRPAVFYRRFCAQMFLRKPKISCLKALDKSQNYFAFFSCASRVRLRVRIMCALYFLSHDPHMWGFRPKKALLQRSFDKGWRSRLD